MDHIAVPHVDGPVLVADTEYLNQVSNLGLFTKLQQEDREIRLSQRLQQGPNRALTAAKVRAFAVGIIA